MITNATAARPAEMLYADAMKILVIEDDREAARVSEQGAVGGGSHGPSSRPMATHRLFHGRRRRLRRAGGGPHAAAAPRTASRSSPGCAHAATPPGCADPLGARRGRRPRHGPARRRRRLSDEGPTPSPSFSPARGAAPPRQRQGGGDRLPRRRPSSSTGCRIPSSGQGARSSCNRASSSCSNI